MKKKSCCVLALALALFLACKEESNSQKTSAPASSGKRAPDKFGIHFKTTKGDFKALCYRAWAPNGADRIYELARSGYFKDIAFFRAISGFMVQFGIHGDPKVSAQWRPRSITDDPVAQSNTRGRLTFAMAGKDTRTTQIFINFANNTNLDRSGFSPVCEVSAEEMKVVDKIYTGYGEGAPRGKGPAQHLIQSRGNAYLKEAFPRLDYIKSATLF